MLDDTKEFRHPVRRVEGVEEFQEARDLVNLILRHG
jgi:hypothetical protein